MKVLCLKDLNYKINLDNSPYSETLQLFFNTDIVKFKKGKVYKYKTVEFKYINRYKISFRRFQVKNEYNQEAILSDFIYGDFFREIKKKKN